mmetsp:Transcript_67843/g.220894  ORF Transcript_67843/g.220894 Transcript_67843/m.220894 type:complete len:427 (+) Transcript_67843:145-1425(+)
MWRVRGNGHGTQPRLQKLYDSMGRDGSPPDTISPGVAQLAAARVESSRSPLRRLEAAVVAGRHEAGYSRRRLRLELLGLLHDFDRGLVRRHPTLDELREPRLQHGLHVDSGCRSGCRSGCTSGCRSGCKSGCRSGCGSTATRLHDFDRGLVRRHPTLDELCEPRLHHGLHIGSRCRSGCRSTAARLHDSDRGLVRGHPTLDELREPRLQHGLCIASGCKSGCRSGCKSGCRSTAARLVHNSSQRWNISSTRPDQANDLHPGPRAPTGLQSAALGVAVGLFPLQICAQCNGVQSVPRSLLNFHDELAVRKLERGLSDTPRRSVDLLLAIRHHELDLVDEVTRHHLYALHGDEGLRSSSCRHGSQGLALREARGDVRRKVLLDLCLHLATLLVRCWHRRFGNRGAYRLETFDVQLVPTATSDQVLEDD